MSVSRVRYWCTCKWGAKRSNR